MKRYIIIDLSTNREISSGLLWYCKHQARKLRRSGRKVAVKNGGRYI